MRMSDSGVWWLLAGGAVAVELLTGTFYLLMIAIGMAAGALAAYADLSLTWQLLAAALVGGGAVTAWHLKRNVRPASEPASANKDVNLDVGETVHIAHWKDDGTAITHYRGAQWTVVAAPDAPQQSGSYRIVEVVGSRLVVAPA